MSRTWPPAALPAAAFLAGALAAQHLEAPRAPAVALVALGLSLRTPAGALVAAASVGLLRGQAAAAARPEADAGWDPERPVVVGFSLAGAWERRGPSWSAPVEIQRLEQDGAERVLARGGRVTLSSSSMPPAGGCFRARGYLRAPLSFHNGALDVAGGLRLRVKSLRLLEPLADADLGGCGSSGASALRATGEPGEKARIRLRRALERSGEGAPGAALLEGLLLGRPEMLQDSWRQGLRRTGLAHLFAVSGLHVGLVAALAWTVGARCGPPRRALLALVAAAAYSWLVGLGPTVMRALVMLLAVLAARLLRRAPSPLNGLALAAMGLAAARPELVDDLSFRLTVAATAGVLGLGPWLAGRWGGGALARALATSVGAQLATLPVTLPAFFLLPLGGVFLNLVAVPWTALCLGLALPWALLALISPAAASALLPLFDLLARPFGWLAAVPVRPWISLPLALGAVGASVLTLLALTLLSRPKLLAPAAAAAILVPACAGRDPDLAAFFLDVGQGDGVLLRDGRGALLVDGGGWTDGDFGRRVLLPALARLGVRSLEVALISHPDADHCAGVADLAAYVAVEELWTAPGWSATPCLERLAATAHPRLRVLWRGDRLRWRRFELEVLHPPPGRRGGTNERSLVVAARGAGRTLLLTGDIAGPIEAELVRARTLVPSDVLKVPHHGSGGSSSLPFLSSTRPRWAVISVGRGNGYGHPAIPALDRLARRAHATVRTDRHGRISMRWREGGPLRVEVARAALAAE